MKAGLKVAHKTVTREAVKEELAAYEKKFGMTSSEFLKRFHDGELGDHELMPWEFYCDMAKELGIRLR